MTIRIVDGVDPRLHLNTAKSVTRGRVQPCSPLNQVYWLQQGRRRHIARQDGRARTVDKGVSNPQPTPPSGRESQGDSSRIIRDELVVVGTAEGSGDEWTGRVQCPTAARNRVRVAELICGDDGGGHRSIRKSSEQLTKCTGPVRGTEGQVGIKGRRAVRPFQIELCRSDSIRVGSIDDQGCIETNRLTGCRLEREGWSLQVNRPVDPCDWTFITEVIHAATPKHECLN